MLMHYLKLIGYVVVGWCYLVSAVCILTMLGDWLDHRRDGKRRRVEWVLQLWRNGIFTRVR